LESLLLPLQHINEACFDGPAARMSAAGFFYFQSPAAKSLSQALTRKNFLPDVLSYFITTLFKTAAFPIFAPFLKVCQKNHF
jgi:hypothetical protein